MLRNIYGTNKSVKFSDMCNTLKKLLSRCLLIPRTTPSPLSACPFILSSILSQIKPDNRSGPQRGPLARHRDLMAGGARLTIKEHRHTTPSRGVWDLSGAARSVPRFDLRRRWGPLPDCHSNATNRQALSLDFRAEPPLDVTVILAIAGVPALRPRTTGDCRPT